MWELNDASIDDDDVLFHRVPKRPDFRVVDPVKKTVSVNPAAIRHDPGSGMSVQIESLMLEHSVPVEILCNWDTHGAVSFEAHTPRNVGGGVIAEPDDDDPALGKVHGLVRHSNPEPTKSEWKDIRAAIRAKCIWIDRVDRTA